METDSSVAAARGGSLQSPSMKEWRAASDSHNSTDYVGLDLEQLKLDQTDERTIYENGREPRDLDAYSTAMDGSCSDAKLLEQLHSVSKQRGELQQQEIELSARMMAMDIQRNYETRSAEFDNAAAIMQEQLHEKDRSIREMERIIEEKDKELATLRRERDHTEAKISELQEHIQEKERQFTELQEQNRIAQESILCKDEQLREAQGWIARAQEMDALQSSTNHSLQAELRERTEQYNQLWHCCQRQFADMERLHMHTVQQLQLELANIREGGGSKTNSKGASQIIQNSGNKSEAHENSRNQFENKDVDLVTHGYLQAGQMTPLHSFVMHQQEIPQLVQPRGPSSHVAQSMLLQQKYPMQNHVHPSQGVHRLVSSDAKSDYQVPANGQYLGQGYLDMQNSQKAQYGSTTPTSSVNEKVGDVSSLEANGQVSPGEKNGPKSIVPDTRVSSGKAERILESDLLDERSLLACIVRTIPAGGRIRISSTLPNRLGKMLAPLHWHDYRKKYGKLDDFVASHVELFVIEDDYIQVREGAQKMVAASASAAAKVTATATASSSPKSMYVAMTPMAQSHGLKKSVHRESISNVKILSKPPQQISDYMAKQ